MSCRRKDRRNLVGCNIGAVAIRGCSRECCPYSDEDRINNERISYGEHASWQGYDNDSSFLNPSSERYRPCRHNYRPKYVCVPCRRTFKLFLHPELEYFQCKGDNTYFCRPRATFAEQRVFFASRGLKTQRDFEEIDMKRNAVFSSPRRYKDDELDAMRKKDPWIWIPLSGLRCPGCSKPGTLVGNTFRAPPFKDVKGWDKVSQDLAKGVRFTFCPSQELHEELVMEGRRMKERDARAAVWEKEKRRRIAALNLKHDSSDVTHSSALTTS